MIDATLTTDDLEQLRQLAIETATKFGMSNVVTALDGQPSDKLIAEHVLALFGPALSTSIRKALSDLVMSSEAILVANA